MHLQASKSRVGNLPGCNNYVIFFCLIIRRFCARAVWVYLSVNVRVPLSTVACECPLEMITVNISSQFRKISVLVISPPLWNVAKSINSGFKSCVAVISQTRWSCSAFSKLDLLGWVNVQLTLLTGFHNPFFKWVICPYYRPSHQ